MLLFNTLLGKRMFVAHHNAILDVVAFGVRTQSQLSRHHLMLLSNLIEMSPTTHTEHVERRRVWFWVSCVCDTLVRFVHICHQKYKCQESNKTTHFESKCQPQCDYRIVLPNMCIALATFFSPYVKANLITPQSIVESIQLVSTL